MENQLANLETEHRFFDPTPTNREQPTDDELLLLNDEINTLFEEIMSDGVIAVNSDGIILSFNTKAGEIFGYSAKEAIGKNVGDLILLEYPNKLDSCIVNFLNLNRQIKFLDRLYEVPEKSEDTSIVPLKFSVGKTHFDDRLLITVMVQHVDQEKLRAKNEQRLIKKLTEVDQLLVKKNSELHEYKHLLRKEIDKRKRLNDKLSSPKQ